MGITSQCLCESDNPSKHPGGCVRCKTGHQMANQVAFLLDVVERLHAVVSCKLIVNELGGSEQIFSAVVGYHDVLHPELDNLVNIFNRISVAVLFIAHFMQLFDADADFPWNKMGQRQIG